MAGFSESSLHYGKPATLDEAARFLDLAGEAFSFDSSRPRAALERDGWEDIRTLKADGELVAGLYIYPSAQWFGGRRLASHAIAAVVTAPHRRRRGLGRALMLAMLREARENGVPLSVLHATTPAFYRGLGYEPAGDRCVYKADIHELPRDFAGARIVPRALEDQAAIRSLYRAFAERHAGCLDRTEHLWRRHFQPYDDSKRYLYDLEFSGAMEGYVCLARSRDESVLVVDDVVCLTPRAAMAALAFMARHSSTARSVVFPDGPQGPLHKLICENRVRPAYGSHGEWLLRIIDVATALRQCRYPELDLELHLDVVDDSLEENAGRYLLRVDSGQASVDAGGSGRIRLDVRALAAIYTGCCHPREMRAAGLLHGADADIDRLGLAFAGPRPFMLDDF